MKEESKKSPGIERERIFSLHNQLATLNQKLECVEKRQAAGDNSAETCRLVNILRHKIEVTENRIAGKFEGDNYKIQQEITIPHQKPTR